MFTEPNCACLANAGRAGSGLSTGCGSAAANTTHHYASHVDGDGDALLTWAAETDGFVVNVEVADFPEGRGLAAKRAIRPGEVLLFIPDGHILRPDRQPDLVARTGSSGNPSNEGSNCATMATRLLQEAIRGERSLYSHYIRALPPTSALPANLPTLSGPVIPLLRSFVAELADEPSVRLGQLVADGLSCADAVVQRMDVPTELAVWACSMALSRKFRSESGSEMWPIADLLNHNPDTNLAQSTRVTSLNGQSGGGLRAVRKYLKGEQVFDYYGQAPNLLLLCQYGFTTNENTLGTPTVLTTAKLSPEVREPQSAPWMHNKPKSDAQAFLGACGNFLQMKDRQNGAQSLRRKAITSLKVNSSFGFEPIGLDCSRIGRYGFGSMRDFTASLASRMFTPVSSTLKELAASLPATKRTSSTSMQQIDTAVFGDVFQRCSTFMKAFETPAFLAASRLIDLQQPEHHQGSGTAILRALREEQTAAHHCVTTAREFMRRTYGVDLMESAR